MKTVICIEIDHDRPIPTLARLIAGRAWTIQGVTRAEVMQAERIVPDIAQLQRHGFTSSEIALGMTEVVRA